MKNYRTYTVQLSADEVLALNELRGDDEDLATEVQIAKVELRARTDYELNARSASYLAGCVAKAVQSCSLDVRMCETSQCACCGKVACFGLKAVAAVSFSGPVDKWSRVPCVDCAWEMLPALEDELFRSEISVGHKLDAIYEAYRSDANLKAG